MGESDELSPSLLLVVQLSRIRGGNALAFFSCSEVACPCSGVSREGVAFFSVPQSCCSRRNMIFMMKPFHDF